MDKIDTSEPKWWQRFDWTEDMTVDGKKVASPETRACMLADMFADDEAQFDRYFDEIYADILRMESKLN